MPHLSQRAAVVAALVLPLALTTTSATSATHADGTRSAHKAERTARVGGVLSPVPTNRVTGAGYGSLTLRGNQARVNVSVAGLLDRAPHAMHIHVDGAGVCPTAKDAKPHNGRLSLNVADGMASYGMIGTSLTTRGDTSPASALATDRFPQRGTFHYSRSIRLSDNAVANVRSGKAVIVVHGIDYNRNGAYDGVLGASELDPKLPAEATNPALCGALR